jgi:hypothetical protein
MMVNKTNPSVSWKNLAPALGGVSLIFLLLRLATPAPPPANHDGDYTFQPEPRRPKIDLGASSGMLLGQPLAAPSPSLETGSCTSLQEFANFEYAKRHRQGKVADLLSFSGFAGADVFVTGSSTLNCSGGAFLRKGKSGSRACKNVILSYDTASNTLTYNIQYVYLERGLQPECTVSP